MQAKENEETDNPLAQEIKVCWEVDTKSQIKMDLSRTEFFVGELSEKESYDFCFGILYWWSVRQTGLGYRQGMNEIISVIMKAVFEFRPDIIKAKETAVLIAESDSKESQLELENEVQNNQKDKKSSNCVDFENSDQNNELLLHQNENKKIIQQTSNSGSQLISDSNNPLSGETANINELSNKHSKSTETQKENHTPPHKNQNHKFSQVELKETVFADPVISNRLIEILSDKEFACALLFEKLMENGVDKFYHFEAKGVKRTELFLHQSVHKIFKKRLKVYIFSIFLYLS